MKHPIPALLIALASVASIQASAQQSPWAMRARAVHIEHENGSDPINGAGSADRVSLNKKEIPELDLSYFFTPNVAAELSVNNQQKYTAYLDDVSVGSLKHMPIALNLQYHFSPESALKPYVGVGVNYTRLSAVHVLNDTASLEHSSYGWVAQAGFDIQLDRNWMLNFDVKKMRVHSELSISGAKASNLQIDPWLIGVGLGYRF
jgi:outer membrane protein